MPYVGPWGYATNMSKNHRAFQFEGSDKDYIVFLETQLSAALNRGISETVNVSAISLPSVPASASSNSTSSISVITSDSNVSASIAKSPSCRLENCDTMTQIFHPPASSISRSTDQGHLRFLYYDPIKGQDIDRTRQDIPELTFPKQISISETQGMRELRCFVNEIQESNRWNKKKADLGLNSLQVNKATIEALCGRKLSSGQQEEPTLYPDNYPSDRKTLVLRGCDYGALAKDKRMKGELLLHVAKFQQLVFVSFCVVMLETGTPIDVVDWMMRHFISDTGPQNLRRLRYGSVWVNTCISKLLDQKWGFKSWELFLLFPRTIQQYGRFANTRHSSEIFARDMGTPGQQTPFTEDIFIPYCVPCFIKVIAGDELQLVDICNILGYSILHVSSTYEKYFNNEPWDFNPFTYAYNEPVVDFNPFTYAYGEPVVDFNPFTYAHM